MTPKQRWRAEYKIMRWSLKYLEPPQHDMFLFGRGFIWFRLEDYTYLEAIRSAPDGIDDRRAFHNMLNKIMAGKSHTARGVKRLMFLNKASREDKFSMRC